MKADPSPSGGNMADEVIKQLLEAGVHFGHQTRRWNPKMKKFIFGQRSGIYIIDLEKTAECLNTAQAFVRNLANQGGRVLFIGTKKQAQVIIEETAEKCQMYHMRNRWPGGLLTNYETIRKSINRLEVIEKMEKDGTINNLKKKEISMLGKEKTKLIKDFGGIREMKTHPDAVFIVDPKKEEIAVKEARRLHIPIIALVDTNCDPDVVDYPIPGNDDALKSLRLICTMISDSVLSGRKEYLDTQTANEKKIKTTDSKPESAAKPRAKVAEATAAAAEVKE